MPGQSLARKDEKMRVILETLGAVTNQATSVLIPPYHVEASIRGSSPMLFHAWSVEGIEAKAKAAKGSAAKKSDDIESYVYRNINGELCIPSEYVRMSIIEAARYIQDPRSPRKSARDLFKAGIIVGPGLCGLGVKEWDYLDRRRVMVQRNGITRCRPAMWEGWKVSCEIDVLLPEYIAPTLLNEALSMAGRLVGVGDFRPTFGRFQIIQFQVQEEPHDF